MAIRVELFVPETKDWCEVEMVSENRLYKMSHYPPVLQGEHPDYLVEFRALVEDGANKIKRYERLDPRISGPVNVRTCEETVLHFENRPYFALIKSERYGRRRLFKFSVA